jgi:uncharacterized protein YjlB
MLYVMSQESKKAKITETVQIRLKDDGRFPNNQNHPVLIYRHIFSKHGDNLQDFSSEAAAIALERVFRQNDWEPAWRNGIYDYHHYHSTAHEVLGVYSGSAVIKVGGKEGSAIEIAPGDVIIVPAGVSHILISSRDHLGVVGAYPIGQKPDLLMGDESDRPQADYNIAQVPEPPTDPVYGDSGKLTDIWPS